jgi:8-oxo-dGTP pyrophosphatase MutT (NUDIX family)
MPSAVHGVGGSVRPVPLFRPTARLIVVDPAGRVLLFGGTTGPNAAVRAWITPGGGVRAGESLAEAGARELAEETGHVVAPAGLGPVVASSAGLWRAGEQLFFGADSFFLVRVEALVVDDSGHEAFERELLAVHRWWTTEELDQTMDPVLPEGLSGLLRLLLTQGAPGQPVRLPWGTALAQPG